MHTKFNTETLKSDRKALDNKEHEIMDILYNRGVDNLTHQELYKLFGEFRGIINVAAMYNDVIEQQLSLGYVETSNPQNFITQRLP